MDDYEKLIEQIGKLKELVELEPELLGLIEKLEAKAASLEEDKPITAWDRVLAARERSRPQTLDYINRMFDGFIEMHGDRRFGDDKAMIGGIAWLDDIPVTVIGQEKGRSIKRRIYRNFGMPNPEGYRKALRLMKQAEKFGRPVICLVDTPGAYCGIGAEERGQGLAIAENLYEMAGLKTPIITVLIGEGGSGGALALAVSDLTYMLENSVFSVITPEGCASILWKDAKKAEQAAEAMKLTAEDLKSIGIVDKVFGEPEHYTRSNMDDLVLEIKTELIEKLTTLMALSSDELVERRQKKHMAIGRSKA